MTRNHHHHHHLKTEPKLILLNGKPVKITDLDDLNLAPLLLDKPKINPALLPPALLPPPAHVPPALLPPPVLPPAPVYPNYYREQNQDEDQPKHVDDDEKSRKSGNKKRELSRKKSSKRCSEESDDVARKAIKLIPVSSLNKEPKIALIDGKPHQIIEL